MGGTGEALNEQRIIQTSVEKESHQFQLGSIVHKTAISAVRGVQLLVTGRHI